MLLMTADIAVGSSSEICLDSGLVEQLYDCHHRFHHRERPCPPIQFIPSQGYLVPLLLYFPSHFSVSKRLFSVIKYAVFYCWHLSYFPKQKFVWWWFQSVLTSSGYFWIFFSLTAFGYIVIMLWLWSHSWTYIHALRMCLYISVCSESCCFVRKCISVYFIFEI